MSSTEGFAAGTRRETTARPGRAFARTRSVTQDDDASLVAEAILVPAPIPTDARGLSTASPRCPGPGSQI